MKLLFAIVMLLVGGTLILIPTLYGRGLDASYCIWSMVAGFGLCLASVVMGFMMIGQTESLPARASIVAGEAV